MKLPDGTSVRKCFTVKNRAEADELLTEKLSMVKRGLPTPAREWILADFLDYWLTDVVSLKCRPRTVEVYESKIRIYIKPAIGRKRLKDISVMDVQSLLNDAVATGNLRAAGQVKQVLRAALNRAMREELIMRNVATLTEMPQPRPKRITPWSAEEAARFIQGTEDHKWHIGYVLAALYGLRRGEVAGLRWSDIDLDAGTIQIEQQAQWLGGVITPAPVKTDNSRRTLPILPQTHQALIDHFAKESGVQRSPIVLAQFKTDQRPLITGPKGGYVDPGAFSAEFLRLAEGLQLPRITVHILRHTAATNLKNVGVPARDVQLILGHAHVSTTQQLYQHADTKGQANAISLVEKELMTAATSVGGGQNWRSDSIFGEFLRRESGLTPGGPAGTRTPDTLLKSYLTPPYSRLPTPVRERVRALTVPYLLGAIAVGLGGQSRLRTSAGFQPNLEPSSFHSARIGEA